MYCSCTAHVFYCLSGFYCSCTAHVFYCLSGFYCSCTAYVFYCLSGFYCSCTAYVFYCLSGFYCSCTAHVFYCRSGFYCSCTAHVFYCSRGFYCSCAHVSASACFCRYWEVSWSMHIQGTGFELSLKEKKSLSGCGKPSSNNMCWKVHTDCISSHSFNTEFPLAILSCSIYRTLRINN